MVVVPSEEVIEAVEVSLRKRKDRTGEILININRKQEITQETQKPLL